MPTDWSRCAISPYPPSIKNHGWRRSPGDSRERVHARQAQNGTTMTSTMTSKVPQITLAIWIIKILATTLGETAGDVMSITLNLGYAVSTAFFIAIFLVTL